MNSQRISERSLDTIGWSLFFIWWGVAELANSLPHGVFAVGIGIILLGLSVARSLNGFPTSGLIIALGIVALVAGGADLARSAWRLPFELPVFAAFLIVLGSVVLVRELLRSRQA